MYFYKAIGRITGKTYYFVSMKGDESAPNNCFPIPETFKDFCATGENPVKKSVVYCLGDTDDTGFRTAVPCLNQKMLDQYADGELIINTPEMESFMEKEVGPAFNSVIKTLKEKFLKE